MIFRDPDIVEEDRSKLEGVLHEALEMSKLRL